MKAPSTNTTCARLSRQALLLTFLAAPALADSDDSGGAYLSGSGGASSSNGEIFRGWFGEGPEAGGPLQGLYLGFGPGMISTDYSDSVNDGSVSMIGGSDEGFAYTFFTGYQFNENFGLEASFTSSDDVDFSAMSSGGPSWSAGPVSAKYDAQFLTLAGFVRYPIAPRWWAIGKVGITWWETTESFNESGFTSSDRDSGSDFFAALGFEYDPGEQDRAIYRFEVGYQPVGGDDDLDILTAAVSFRYQFP